jgi:hypothetical protein
VVLRRVGVALAVVLLAACSPPPPESGYVHSKRHTDAYVWFMTVCASTGKYGCTSYTMIPITEPEHWRLCLIDDKGDRSGTCRNRDVTPAEWHRYDRGQHYPDAR